MSSFYVSNSKHVAVPTDIFLRRGQVTTEKKLDDVNIIHRRSRDHSGVFEGKNGFIVSDGFCYGAGFQSIADNLTDDVEQIKELLNTLNGDYSIYINTHRYHVIATDVWKTKQVFVAVDPDGTFWFCSMPDMIRNQKRHAYPLGANTMLVLDKNNGAVQKHTIKKWNLSQKDTSHTKVFDALEESVRIRFDEQSITTLSSGYDSGVISCAVAKLGHSDFSVSFANTEDKTVLAKRIQSHKGKILLEDGQMDGQERKDLESIYVQNEIFSEAGEAVARVCKYMNKINKSNILSGNGGDEMYSDYGYVGQQMGPNSLFGGLFPQRLEVAWPWHEYLNRQSQLVSRLDIITGYYGIQHKEPLLDVNLVQAWLNTTQALKNKRYKNWMYEYMRENNYPLAIDSKIGFAGKEKKLGEDQNISAMDGNKIV